MLDHSRILTRLINTPLYMDSAKATIITENISVRLALGQALDTGITSPTKKEILQKSNNNLAIIKVFDSLVSKNGAGESGFTSYENIINQSEAFRKAGIKTICFWGDSSGGEALGMLRASNYIRALPSLGVHTFGFTDGMNCSACYGLLSAVQTLYAMPDSKSGSIGTVLTLMDVTKRDEQQGIKYLIMRSKDEKAMYNPHEVVSEEVAAKAQAEMMVLDNLFNQLVNKNRPQLSIEQIISFKGNAFYGEEALSLGLVDKLVSGFDEVLSLEGVSTNKIGKFNMNEEELLKQNAELQAKLAALQVASDMNAKTIMAAERERVSKLTLAANTLKIPQERLAKAIDSGISYEDGLVAFETFAEISGVNSVINTSVETPQTASNTQTIPNKDNPFAFLSAMDEAINRGLLGA